MEQVQSNTHIASVFQLFAEKHLLTHDQIQEEFFHDVVDRSVKAGEVDAELGQDSTQPMMSEEEFNEIMRASIAKRQEIKKNGCAGDRVIVPSFSVPMHQAIYPGAMTSQCASRKSMFVSEVKKILPADGVATEMGLGEARVIGHVENPITPINEFHQEMLKEPERLVLGGCIPSVRWSELDSIIAYLSIFRDMVTPEAEERLGKPARTKAELNAEIEAEQNSPTYLTIVKKLRRRLLVDGVLDLDITRRLNDAKFTVSYIHTLKQLTVEITADYKLSWEV